MKYLSVLCLFCLLGLGCGDDLSFKALPFDPAAVAPVSTQGATGPQGPSGERGEAGPKGERGEAGKDAEVGPFSIIAVIDPCGDKPGHQDEIIFQFSDGTFLAFFRESDDEEFLTLLEWGKSYRTTDEQECRFKISVDGKYQE